MLSKYPWENFKGLPHQIMMQAQKKKLLDALRSRVGTLDEAIRVQEN
jgi:hypothetical protein